MGNPLSKELREARNKDELDLSKWKKGPLKQVPPTIKLCKKLLRLYLHNNQLIDLPKELGFLDSLESLDFSNNNVNQFPLNLPNSLKIIKGSHNRLFYSLVTPKIGELSNLQTLDLSFNQLE